MTIIKRVLFTQLPVWFWVNGTTYSFLVNADCLQTWLAFQIILTKQKTKYQLTHCSKLIRRNAYLQHSSHRGAHDEIGVARYDFFYFALVNKPKKGKNNKSQEIELDKNPQAFIKILKLRTSRQVYLTALAQDSC